MSEFLDNVYLGNSFLEWGITIFGIILSVLVAWLVYLASDMWLKRWLARIGFHRLSTLIDMLEEPIAFFLAVLGARLNLNFLALPRSIQVWTHEIIFETFLIFGFIWLVGRLYESYVWYSASRQDAEGTQRDHSQSSLSRNRILLLLIVGLAIATLRHLDGLRACPPTCNGSNLIQADLSETDLREAVFVEADLRGANLSGVDLSGVDLSGANLTDANLENANLTDTLFIGANLTRASMAGAIFVNTDFRGADMHEANLTRADLTSAHLVGINLESAKLVGADLSGVDLAGDNLARVNLNGAMLAGSHLAGTTMSLANLKAAVLTDTDLSGAILNEAVFTRVRSSSRWCSTRS